MWRVKIIAGDTYRLVGVGVKGVRIESGGLRFNSRFRCGSFLMLSHTSELKIRTLVVTLPGARCYRVSAGTGWPGVHILCMRHTV